MRTFRRPSWPRQRPMLLRGWRRVPREPGALRPTEDLAGAGSRTNRGKVGAMPGRRTAIRCAGACTALFGLLTVLVATEWAPLADADTSVLLALHDLAARNRWLDATLTAVSTVLAPWVFRVASAVTALTLLARARWHAPTARHRALQRRLALFVLITVAVGGLLSAGWKVVLGRNRPPAAVALDHASGMSYPSGHAVGVTVAVTVTLGAIYMVTGRPPAAWLSAMGLLVVAAVGLSRLALGVHYLSDVLGGCLLGLAWTAGAAAAALTPVDRRCSAPTSAVSPPASGQQNHDKIGRLDG